MKSKKEQRLGEIKLNNQGNLMKIITYNNKRDIVVEFQDKYKARVHSQYNKFLDGGINNPYYPSVYGIGVTGNKYPVKIDNKIAKEYLCWRSILQRCYDDEYKIKHPTYQNVICCEEWLLYEKFYEWLHSQENFDKWHNNNGWNIDKDILVKGNKIYSPETCCLVPNNVNKLFVKCDASRGNLPIGVCKMDKKFLAYCQNPITHKRENLGRYFTPEKAFYVYKEYKENLIKQIAQIEYDKGNIIKKCYDAMMIYKVEITD